MLEHSHDTIVQDATRAREYQAGQGRLRLQRQQNIVVEGQRGQHAGDLELQAHAGPRPLRRSGGRELSAPGKKDRTMCRDFRTRHAFHQGALAGPVGSDQAVKFVLGDDEIAAFNAVSLPKDLDQSTPLQGGPWLPFFGGRPKLPTRSRLAQHQTY